MTLVERKREMRRVVSAAIEGGQPAARAAADERICATLLAMPEFAVASEVLTYWPLADEVDVSPFNLAAIAAGKAVYLPTLPPSGNIVYRRWAPGESLTVGRHGVREPASGVVPQGIGGIVLVPGRAFSSAGARLGRGGGYYDRALATLARIGTTIGVAYGCQVYDEVPHGERDERVAIVVSDTRVMRTTR